MYTSNNRQHFAPAKPLTRTNSVKALPFLFTRRGIYDTLTNTVALRNPGMRVPVFYFFRNPLAGVFNQCGDGELRRAR